MREAWPQIPIARPKDRLTDFLRSNPMRPRAQYSAHQSTQFVNFFCDAPEAQRVFLVGDFNHWNKAADPMERMSDGRWLLKLALHHGHHQYYFMIDDKPRLDPKALGTTQNDRGEPVSQIAIS